MYSELSRAGLCEILVLEIPANGSFSRNYVPYRISYSIIRNLNTERGFVRHIVINGDPMPQFVRVVKAIMRRIAFPTRQPFYHDFIPTFWPVFPDFFV